MLSALNLEEYTDEANLHLLAFLLKLKQTPIQR